MKKLAFLIIGIFVLGWTVRVLLPYRASLKSHDDLRARRESFEALVNRIYRVAESRGGRFPASLEELGPITNGSGQLIDVSNYVYRPSARFQSEKIDGTKIVVGENPAIVQRRSLYLLSVEGRYTITLDMEKYGPLLRENGLDPGAVP